MRVKFTCRRYQWVFGIVFERYGGVSLHAGPLCVTFLRDEPEPESFDWVFFGPLPYHGPAPAPSRPLVPEPSEN